MDDCFDNPAFLLVSDIFKTWCLGKGLEHICTTSTCCLWPYAEFYRKTK